MRKRIARDKNLASCPLVRRGSFGGVESFKLTMPLSAGHKLGPYENSRAQLVRAAWAKYIARGFQARPRCRAQFDNK